MKHVTLTACILIVVLLHETTTAVLPRSVIKAGGNLTISIVTDGTYTIGVDDDVWLTSAPTFFNADGRRYSAKDDLKLVETTSTGGTDVLGRWQSTNYVYSAGSWNITASIKTYNKPNLPLVIFQQKFSNGANGTTAAENNHVISGFPSFKMEGPRNKLGYLSYYGLFIGDVGKTIGMWDWGSALVRYGLEAGPLSIFDKHGNSMVISSYSQFMAGSLWHDKLIGGSISWGIMGGVDTVPPGFMYETIIYFGNKGINTAFQGWGSTLKKAYGKSDAPRVNDLTLKYLGYWTDGGAYYYYNTEKNKTYEATILDIKNYTDSKDIPFKYFQYDSWWYYKGRGNGVKTWEAMPTVFPDGFSYVSSKVGLPAGAHNRYWASDTTYAMQNGGNYTFIVETEKAIPTEQRFWDDLLKNATKWGLILYEQDWMNEEFLDLNATLEDINLGRTWLMQMGEGAKKSNMTIQYCMSLPRHMLQSVEIPQVTQARASDDYRPGIKQWTIGITSMFADALGVAPYKDTFWSTDYQPGTHYATDHEPFSELLALISTLSTGPVGPGDMIGGANATLLMRSCNKDGLILKPSKAATAIDAQIMQPKETWAFSHINPSVARNFSDSEPIHLADCTRANYCLYYISPVITLGNSSVALVGEIDKWVPVSPQRITGITVTSDDIMVTVQVANNEVMAIWFFESKLTLIQCKATKAMIMIISYKKGTCVAS